MLVIVKEKYLIHRIMWIYLNITKQKWCTTISSSWYIFPKTTSFSSLLWQKKHFFVAPSSMFISINFDLAPISIIDSIFSQLIMMKCIFWRWWQLFFFCLFIICKCLYVAVFVIVFFASKAKKKFLFSWKFVSWNFELTHHLCMLIDVKLFIFRKSLNIQKWLNSESFYFKRSC